MGINQHRGGKTPACLRNSITSRPRTLANCPRHFRMGVFETVHFDYFTATVATANRLHRAVIVGYLLGSYDCKVTVN